MNSYIYCELSANNSFYCPVEISMLGEIFYGTAKIDTGAYYSFIPLKTLYISDNRCMEIKKNLVYRDEIQKNIYCWG